MLSVVLLYMFSILCQDAHMLPSRHRVVLLYMKWGNFTAGKTGCKTSEAFLYLFHLLLQQMRFRRHEYPPPKLNSYVFHWQRSVHNMNCAYDWVNPIAANKARGTCDATCIFSVDEVSTLGRQFSGWFPCVVGIFAGELLTQYRFETYLCAIRKKRDLFASHTFIALSSSSRSFLSWTSQINIFGMCGWQTWECFSHVCIHRLKCHQEIVGISKTSFSEPQFCPNVVFGSWTPWVFFDSSKHTLNSILSHWWVYGFSYCIIITIITGFWPLTCLLQEVTHYFCSSSHL